MKLVRVEDSKTGQPRYGALQTDGSILALEGNDLFAGAKPTAESIQGRLLAPLIPAAILGIGLNYRLHAEETGMKPPDRPMLFMKTPSSVQDPELPILLPRHLRSDKVDYEAELAVVMGRRCKNVSREEALDYVLGYTCANDVSARDWQKEWGGGQFCRAKTFDTFCPLGPCITTLDEFSDPGALRIQGILNGDVMQDSSTGDMIFDVPTLVSFLSGSTTLLPGTVILTGTPSGVGMGQRPYRWLEPGDSISIVIEGIGTLTNTVEEESLS